MSAQPPEASTQPRTRLDVLPGVDQRRRPSLTQRSRVLVASAVVVSMLTVIGWSVAYASIRGTTEWINKTAIPISQEIAILSGSIETTVGSLADFVIEQGQARRVSSTSGNADISSAEVEAEANDVRASIARILARANTTSEVDSTRRIVQATRRVQAAFEAWRNADAVPTISALLRGDVPSALATTRSNEAWDKYLAMRQSVKDLGAVAAREQDAAVNDVDDATMLMGGAAVLVTLLGMFVTGLYAWNLRSLVTDPMRLLARDIHTVTDEGKYYSRVTPIGPEELHTMGSQIEYLRRTLVDEIDQRQSALESLGAEAPCAAAMSEVLRPTPYCNVNEFAVEVYNSPADGVVTADWWAARALPDGSTLFAVVDVSGHSAEAGVVAYGALARCATAAQLTSDVNQIAEAIQSHLVPAQKAQFMCAFVAKLTQTSKDSISVEYINAGGLTATVREADPRRQERVLLPATQPPLWVGAGGETSPAAFVELRSGDTLVVASDGISDVKNSAGERFGVERFLDAVHSVPASMQREIVDGTVSIIREYSASWDADDITVATIRRA